MQEPFYSDVPKHPFRIVNLNCVMHVYVCLLVFSCIIYYYYYYTFVLCIPCNVVIVLFIIVINIHFGET